MKDIDQKDSLMSFRSNEARVGASATDFKIVIEELKIYNGKWLLYQVDAW